MTLRFASLLFLFPVLAAGTGLAAAEPATQGTETNAKVEPGRVHWHADFAAACAAAQNSGKPVLLFHMMGNLDRQFC